MRISSLRQSICHLLPILSLSSYTAAQSAPSQAESLTVYAWPLPSASPVPLASISLTKSRRSSTSDPAPPLAKLTSYTPPSLSDLSSIVRIGLYDPSTKAWRGSATSGATLHSAQGGTIVLHVDVRGDVFAVGFSGASAEARDDAAGREGKKGATAGKEKGREAVNVEVRRVVPGPKPVLNRPVVLNEEGKVEMKPQGDTRTFLQKYWWAIALFLLLQVLAGGGKE